MKSFRKIILIAGVLAVVLIAGLSLFLSTFNLNRYRGVVLEQAGRVVHRTVDIRDMRLTMSFRQGVGITARKMSVRDDPRFQNGDFLAAERVFLGVDIIPLLTRREISIAKIEIISPRVTIIRAADGSINVQTLGRDPLPSPVRPQVSPSAGSGASSSAALPAFLVRSLRLDDGGITYIDKTCAPELVVPFTGVDVTVENFSLNAPAHFSVRAAVLSEIPNVHMDGTVQFDSSRSEVIVTNADAEIDLGRIDSGRLYSVAPMLKEFIDTRALKGKLKAAVDTLKAGAQGLSVLSVNASLDAGPVAVKQLAVPLDPLKAQAAVTTSQIVFKEASCGLGKGTIKLKGAIDDYLKGRGFSFSIGAEDVNFQEVLDQRNQPVNLSGILTAQMDLAGAGLTPDTLMTLSGEGHLAVKDARIRDFNIFKIVLTRMYMLPGLYEKIRDSVPEPYKTKLMEKDTVFKQIELPCVVESGILSVQPCVIEAEGFLLSGRLASDLGQLSSGEPAGAYALPYRFEGIFVIADDLSRSMIAEVPELQYLADENSRLSIPLTIQGKGQGLPNITLDLEKLAMRKGVEELGKVLDKVLGTTESVPGEEKSNPSNTEQVVNDLLKKILQ